MSETEREIEVVVGVIQGVIQKKADTWQVEVQPDGSQYTKKLWTKDAELVAAMGAKFGQQGAFVCSASYWQGPNGQVRSLWINHAADEADVTYTPAKAPQPTPEAAVALAHVAASQKRENSLQQHGPGTYSKRIEYAPDLKDRMIVRQTALKAAAELVGAMGQSVHPDYDPPLEVMKAAQRFETWVYRDIDPPPIAPELSEHDDNIPF